MLSDQIPVDDKWLFARNQQQKGELDELLATLDSKVKAAGLQMFLTEEFQTLRKKMEDKVWVPLLAKFVDLDDSCASLEKKYARMHRLLKANSDS